MLDLRELYEIKDETPAAHPYPEWRTPWATWWIVALGFAVGFIVVSHGTHVWQLVRVIVVLAVTVVGVNMLAYSPRVRGAVAFAFGVIGTTVGAGIGIPYARKTGMSLTTLSGSVALVAGVVLLVGGAVGTTRTAKGWWRPVMGAGLSAITFVALLSLTFALAATNVPPTTVGAETPGNYGLVYENVTFRTADGELLSGWYIPSHNRAAVVLLHGAGSTRSNVLRHAAVLANNGYGVLLFDARGHGWSEGHAMDFGWYGDADTSAAVSYVSMRADVDPARIGAVGMSMGGEEALGAAAHDPRVHAVVAEGATNRVAGDRVWLSDVYGVRGWLQRGLDRLTYGAADVFTSAKPPITLADAAAQMAPRRVLLITAGKVADEGHAGRNIQQAAPESVELWEAVDADHTDALAVHPDEWEATVVEFLEGTLQPE